MLDLQTKCCPRPSASGNILSSGPTYHMLPSSPVNNFIIWYHCLNMSLHWAVCLSQTVEWDQRFSVGRWTAGEHATDVQDHVPGSDGAADNLWDNRSQDWCCQRGNTLTSFTFELPSLSATFFRRFLAKKKLWFWWNYIYKKSLWYIYIKLCTRYWGGGQRRKLSYLTCWINFHWK